MELNCEFSIDQLPDFLLYEVFKNLEPDDLRNCFKVCHRWKEFITDYFDLEVEKGLTKKGDNEIEEEKEKTSPVSKENTPAEENTDSAGKETSFFEKDSLPSKTLPVKEIPSQEDNPHNENFTQENTEEKINFRSCSTDECCTFLDKERKHDITNRKSVTLDCNIRSESMLVEVGSNEMILIQNSDDSADSVQNWNDSIVSNCCCDSPAPECSDPLNEILANESPKVIRDTASSESLSFVWTPSSDPSNHVEASQTECLSSVPKSPDLDSTTSVNEPLIPDSADSLVVFSSSESSDSTNDFTKLKEEKKSSVSLETEPITKINDLKSCASEVKILSDCFDQNRNCLLILDHIVLKKGSPAVQKLLWSTVPYNKIDFGYVLIEDNEEGEELQDLWKALGSTVTHVNFSGACHAPCPIEVFTIISHFNHLVTLEVDYRSQIRPLKRSYLRSTEDIVLPTSLSSVILHRLMADDLECYNFFINTLPSSCLIYIRSAVDVNRDEDNYLKLIKKGAKRIKDLGCELLTMLLSTFKGILVSQTVMFQLDSIEVDLAELEATNHLDLVIKHNPDVNELKLKNCVTFMSYSQLTHLHVNFAQDVKSFKLLQGLKHLQSFEFEFQNPRWKCFFGHDVFELSSLRYLGVNTEKQCVQCWSSLLQSCTLDSFSLVSNSEILFKISHLVSQHQSQLKTLEYICTGDQLTRREKPDQNLTHIFDHIQTPLVALQELTLRNLIYNSDFGDKICEVMNNLVKLELEGSFVECNEIFKAVMCRLAKLQTLVIHKYEETSGSLSRPSFFDTLNSCRQTLQYLTINTKSQVVNEDELKRVFENLPKLKVINFNDGFKSRINVTEQ